jgi:hypothetical protein
MVLARLAGRKTQTRRLIRGRALEWLEQGFTPEFVANPDNHLCPYGVPVDRLWVRENWRARLDEDHLAPRDLEPRKPWYCATGSVYGDEQPSGCAGGVGRLRPAMFMPRWASRGLDEIVEVRVQRLQEISEGDAEAEGIDLNGFRSNTEGIAGREHVIEYAKLWDSINGKRAPWEANAWVWAISFRVIA